VLVKVHYSFQTRLFLLDYWFSQITTKGIYMGRITFHIVLWHFQLTLSQEVKKTYMSLKISFYLCRIILIQLEAEILSCLSQSVNSCLLC